MTLSESLYVYFGQYVEAPFVVLFGDMEPFFGGTDFLCRDGFFWYLSAYVSF
ncbi:MAG: hypothetical protein CM1200mP41_37280 [Gammaproteobacteria bacterium]|nr:MAG: hypothetical protein CM1200mP41_37280 [Gammaproteobacteria bacterium]